VSPRCVGCVVLAGCVGLVCAPAASASDIYQRSGGGDADLVYSGGSAENNNVTVREITISGVPSYEFVEGGAGITGVYSICTLHTPQRATCPRSMPDGTPLDVDAELHGGADTIDMRTTAPASIWGGAGRDTLRGGSAADTIFGYDNFTGSGPDDDDWIDGRAGADAIFGGPEDDTVSYESRSTAVSVSLDDVANDGGFGEGDNVRSDVEVIRGTSAGDTLTGNGATNYLWGFDGFDDLSGLGGDDRIHAGATNDHVEGGDGRDELMGETGADTVLGGAGDDELNGGADDDGLSGGPGADNISGGELAEEGPGIDSVDYAGTGAPVTVTADDFANDGAAGEGDNVRSDVERAFGGSGADTLVAHPGGGEVWGREGNDTLIGQNFDDRLEGGDGDDILAGGFGADLMNGWGGTDTLDYTGHFDSSLEAFGVASTPDGQDNDGNGTLDLSAGNGPWSYDTVGADIEHLIGSEGPDFLQGTFAANRLEGAAGDDILAGEVGNDVLDGGLDADSLDGGPDTDVATYATRTAPVVVSINNAPNDGGAGEGDNVSTSVENVRGGAAGDTLIGSAEVNRLFGGDGNDSLNGGLGADVLDGQVGIDTISYGNRVDPVAVTLDGLRNDGADPNGNGLSTGAEEGDLDLGIENASGGRARDILRAPVADAVANVLRGFAGNDVLEAREGTTTVDTLDCGAGAADQLLRDAGDKQKDCEVELP
jgi:Ca2+-binding RTX toxin-like protein